MVTAPLPVIASMTVNVAALLTVIVPELLMLVDCAVPLAVKEPPLVIAPITVAEANTAVPLLVTFAVRSPPICNEPLLLFVITPLLEVPDVVKVPLLEKVPFNIELIM